MALCLLHAGPALAFSWNADKAQQAEQLLKQFQLSHKVPLVSASVALNGQVAFEINFNPGGSIAPQGEPIRYRIGSVSKQITAGAMLALIEDRTVLRSNNRPIDLETPLSDVFVNVDRASAAGQVTVRRLLNMTSNIPSYTNDELAFSPNSTGTVYAAQPINENQIIQRLRTYRLTGDPPAFDYSNTNYFLLAPIIDVVKGGDRLGSVPASQEFIRQRILSKAGMSSSRFVNEPAPAGAPEAQPNFLRAPLLNQGAWPKGAGDLISTVGDLSRWNIALMSGQVLGKGSLQSMLEPAAPVKESAVYSGCSYAMGWYACDRHTYRLYQHDGVISGFMASNAIARRPDNSWVSVTVLANSDATIDIVELVRGIVRVADQ